MSRAPRQTAALSLSKKAQNKSRKTYNIQIREKIQQKSRNPPRKSADFIVISGFLAANCPSVVPLYADDGQFTASASFSTARGQLVDTFIDKLCNSIFAF